MTTSLKVIIYLMTARVSLLSGTRNKGGPVNITCDNTPVSQMAYRGSSVTINCKYPRAEESIIRSFCREDENFHCPNLISTHNSNYTKMDRFSLRDDKQQGVYNVTISTLTLDDAGRYQCAMKRPNKSHVCLTQIHLHILKWDEITPTAKTCETGSTVQINCSYPGSHENNEKFLCKGENPFNCEELRAVVNGRFDIRDFKRRQYFYVNIKNVSTADAGTYWCGSDRTWQHAIYKIVLSVSERHIKTRRSDHPALMAKPTSVPRSTSPEKDHEQEEKEGEPHNPPDKGMIAGVVVCLVLLLILVIVLILYRHKLPRTQVCCAAGGSSEERANTSHKTEGNHGDHHYEEIQMQNLQASSGDVLPSVYAIVNLPAYHLHYASINFQKNSTDRNALPHTNKNGPSTCDYSSISRPQGATHPPAAEQTLYSTVTMPGGP